MKQITMPSFGSDMERGILTEWLVKPGDQVKRGDSLAVIETHKGAIELDAFDEGTIVRLLIDVGQQTPVGAPIALLRQAGDSDTESDEQVVPAPPVEEAGLVVESSSVAAQVAGAASAGVCTESTADAGITDSGSAAADSRPRVSPAARQLAQAWGVPLSGVTGSGPEGAIRLADVEAALRRPAAPALAAAEAVPCRSGGSFDPQAMREAISATVSRSKREIPHYYLSHTLDISQLQIYLQQLNAAREPDQRILLIVPLLRAIACALVRFPQLNGHYQQSFVAADTVNLANAVNLRGGGLVMPVLKQVERCSMEALMAQLQGLVGRAKAGTLKFSDLDSPTCTVTSIGDRGVDAMWGVIYPPQVAIVGLGCPRDVPLVEQGEVVIRRVITATLSADHRVTDGHYGSRCLCEINKRLQQPEGLWTAQN